MLMDGLIKHQCPFRAVAAAVSSTHIIAHRQFLPLLSERSSVGCFWEVRTHVFQGGTKVNSLWPNPRFVIALHSPNALLETGLRICPPEKRRDGDPFADEQSVL